jgi:hypothetical protein
MANFQDSWKQWGNKQTGYGGSWRGYNPDPTLIQGNPSGFRLSSTLPSSDAYQPNPYEYKGPTRPESDKLSREYDKKMRELQAVNAIQAETSYPEWINKFNVGFGDKSIFRHKSPQFFQEEEPDPPEKSWATGMWDQVKNMGLKDWGNLGVKGLKAWTGLKELEQAEKQNKLAQEAFGFQKAAWNKDFAGRKLAYNTDAQNVNAWKEAQGRTDFNKLMV